MGRKTERDQPVICSGKIQIPYAWPAGRLGSYFLTALRDRRQILGLRCSACGKIMVPPSRCAACDASGTEWIPVGPEGVLVTWTVVRQSPVPAFRTPYLMGVIQLDGADTGLVHFLRDVGPEQVHTGLRVEPVFRAKRSAHILDIRYFRPVKER